MRVLELTSCPACGGQDLLTFDLGGGNHLRRCTDCATVSAPEYAAPEDIYVDGYMFGQVGNFGLDVTHPLFQEYLVRVAHRRIGMIERTSGGPGSLLDVGSGTGEVLMAARDRGWAVQGVEPERTAAQMARERSLDVKVDTLENSGLPEESFDVVSAFHVLEHVPDSRSFLQTMARWVRPGGYVAIEVPNWGSRQRRLLREGWAGLRPLEHLVHFAPQTLARTFRAVGLDPVLLRSPVYLGPPQHLDFALGDLVRGPKLRTLLAPLSSPGRFKGDDVRYPSPAGWAVLRTIEAVYDRAGVGTVVFCVGRVPA